MIILGEMVIGHAFFTRFWYDRIEGGINNVLQRNAHTITCSVVWITQLVVHTEHRAKGLGTKLIRAAFDATMDSACGMVSSHPHAIRAFESATGLKIDPTVVIASNLRGLIRESKIGYLVNAISKENALNISAGQCTIDTSFFVDHTDVNQKLDEERAKGTWDLGQLSETSNYFSS